MSQDLFAAFGEPPAALVQHQQDVSYPIESRNESQADSAGQQEEQDDSDDFGDFEDASVPKEETKAEPPAARMSVRSEPTRRPPAKFPPRAQKRAEPAVPPRDSKIGKHPFADHMDFLFSGGDDEYDAGTDELNDLAHNPEAAMAYSKRIIAEQMEREPGVSAAKLPFSPTQPSASKSQPVQASTWAREPNKLQKKSGYAPARDSSVLFDVDNLSEEEKAETDDDFGDFSATVAEPSSSVRPEPAKPFMPRIDLLGLNDSFSKDAGLDGLTSPRQRHAASVLGLPKDSRPSNLAATATAEDDAWDDFETPDAPPTNTAAPKRVSSPPKSSVESTLLPPTTIPPPSVLLSLSPKIFAQITTNPQVFITHAYALSHILAGRKSRWKRDTILASSMRIGSAAGKGMKLIGVDRAEMAREEREVAECVRGWRAIVGKIRGRGLHVPDMAETMVLKILGVNEGGLKGNRACALCGLRREERVKGVDVDIEDCFGEWWVEGMEMHVVCREFWEQYSKELKTR